MWFCGLFSSYHSSGMRAVPHHPLTVVSYPQVIGRGYQNPGWEAHSAGRRTNDAYSYLQIPNSLPG